MHTGGEGLQHTLHAVGLHAHTPEDTHTPFKYLLPRLLSLADLACPRCRQVCILLGVEPSWAQSKRLLGDPR